MKKKFIILMMILVLVGIPKIGLTEVEAKELKLESEVNILTNYDTYYGSDDYYSYNNSSSVDYNNINDSYSDFGKIIGAFTAAFAGIVIVFVILLLGISIYLIVVEVKIYKKAGKPGWAVIVPIYNMYVLSEFTWGKGWYAFIYLGATLLVNRLDSSISWIFVLGILVLSIMTLYKLAKAFGKDGGFTCGLVFLNPIFMGILAFSSKVKYVGVNGNTNNLGNNPATGVNYTEENIVNNNASVNTNTPTNKDNQRRFCSQCGNSINDSDVFCGSCGNKLK